MLPLKKYFLLLPALISLNLTIIKCSTPKTVTISKLPFFSSSDTNNYAKKYGFTETTDYRDILETAIGYVNWIVDDSLKLKIVPAWNVYQKDSGMEEIPVYNTLITPTGKYSPGFCSLKDRCIFIDAYQIPLLQGIFYHKYKDSSIVTIGDISPEHLVAIILLHEVGHLVNNDTASYFATINKSQSDRLLNIEDNYLKKRELEADKFAALQIKSSSDTTHNKNVQIVKKSLEIQLALLLSGVCQIFNRADKAMKLNVMSNAPEMYFLIMDSSYAHYNMEMRTFHMAKTMSPDFFSDSNLVGVLKQRDTAFNNYMKRNE
jgi:hypothetical protein